MGDSLYMLFYPHWLTDLALAHNAIIVSPNYRLLPEATTPQIFQDVSDFWTYLHSSTLTNFLSSQSPPVEVDLSRVLLVGDSAGGLLSVSTALNYAPDIRAAIATYPCIDMLGPDFTKRRHLPPFGRSLSESLYTNTLASTMGRKAQSSLTSEERMLFMLAAIEHGQLGGLYQRGTEHAMPGERNMYFPMEALDSDDVRVPRGGLTILHGRNDSLVPIGATRVFVERAKGRFGDLVTLAETDGEHGFDGDMRFEGWLKDALKNAVDAWVV
jgi:acetyl esterase/lipase